MEKAQGPKLRSKYTQWFRNFSPSNQTLASLPIMRYRSRTLQFDMRLDISGAILSLQMSIPAHGVHGDALVLLAMSPRKPTWLYNSIMREISRRHTSWSIRTKKVPGTLTKTLSSIKSIDGRYPWSIGAFSRPLMQVICCMIIYPLETPMEGGKEEGKTRRIGRKRNSTLVLYTI